MALLWAKHVQKFELNFSNFMYISSCMFSYIHALLTQVRSRAVELYYAPHLWYPPFYTSLMASSALQH